MKKIYQAPKMCTIRIATEQLVANSMKFGKSNIEEETNVLVKGESSSRSNYNVWDDDWSAE